MTENERRLNDLWTRVQALQWPDDRKLQRQASAARLREVRRRIAAERDRLATALGFPR